MLLILIPAALLALHFATAPSPRWRSQRRNRRR